MGFDGERFVEKIDLKKVRVYKYRVLEILNNIKSWNHEIHLKHLQIAFLAHLS